MGKPKAPAPPDYAAAATAQGTANTNSALATNFLNQANQVNPYGTLTYDYDYNNGQRLPDGTVIPRSTVTTALSPEQQRLLDQNNQMSGQLNDLALKGIGYVDDASSSPIDQSKLPSMVGGVPQQQMSGTIAPTGLSISGAPGSQQLNTNTPGAGPVQNQYDFSGAGAMPSSDDFAAQRDQITNAMMARLQPYIDRDREGLRTQMANQGLGIGSEARDWEQRRQERDIADQRIGALLAGDAEQQRLFSNAMGIRQQGVGEAMSQGNLFNQSQNQLYSQGINDWQARNAAIAGNNAQGIQDAGFTNQAQGQQFAQNQAATDTANQAAASMFNQSLAGGQFANQARQQAIQEADYFKNQPLNMLNALRSGNQTNMPNFGNVMAGSTIAPPPIYQSSRDRYDAEMQAYQAKMANFNAFLGGLSGIGGAAVGKWG